VSQTQAAVEARYNNYGRILSSSFFSGSLLPFSQLGGGRQGEHVTGTWPVAVRVSWAAA
jgi:hypothetical protein